MKVVLMNAISANGFIAKTNGDSDWVKDDKLFDAALEKFGCILIGHTTFRQYENDLYPIEGVTTFVFTHDKKQQNTEQEGVCYVWGEPIEVLRQVKEAGFDKVLLGGGGKTNASFAKAGLIDEMILDVHPVIFGDGIRLLGDYTADLKLKLLKQNDYEDFVQLHYKVIG